MIARIRIVGLKPGALRTHTEVARDWEKLIHKYGGNVLGFYYDEQSQEAIGIAEYESREQVAEIQKNCENDPAFPGIRERTLDLYTCFEEKIVDRLDVCD